MSEEKSPSKFAQEWKAKKIVKKAKKIAIKKLEKDGISPTTARNLVKHAAKKYFSNVGVQEQKSVIE